MISPTTVSSMAHYPPVNHAASSGFAEAITMIPAGSFALQDSGFIVDMWKAFLNKATGRPYARFLQAPNGRLTVTHMGPSQKELEDIPITDALSRRKSLVMRAVPTWEEYEGRFFTHEEGARRLFLAGDHPAVNVNVYEAAACAAFSIKGGRLPTYKERAYAARAGRKGKDVCGVDGDGRLEASNAHWSGPYEHYHRDNIKGTTASSKSYRPTPWGHYDLAGNVDEWVTRFFEGAFQVGHHGGSYAHADPSAFLADGYFNWRNPDFHSHTVGFRVARSVRPGPHLILLGCTND